LASQRSLELAPNPIPPPSARLHHARELAHIGEYVQVMRALAPNTPMAPLAKTIVTLHHLHLLAKVNLPPFVNDFHSKMDLVLDKEAILQVWCMNFCRIVLSLMTLLVALSYF
jgi:hypothetical protein